MSKNKNARFEALNEAARVAVNKRAEEDAAYHHDDNAERKASAERVRLEAEKERMRAEKSLIAQIEQADADYEDSQRRYAAERARSTEVPLRFDPEALTNRVRDLRREGVDAETLRAAFNSMMETAQGEPRVTRASMMTHKDAPKMPSQEEMNRFYVDRYAAGIDDNAIHNESVSAVVDAINSAKSAKSLQRPKPAFKTRVAYFIARKVIGALILICKALGVK